MKLLPLLLLTACIPLSFARGEPRQGVWVVEGHAWIWEVKENVRMECGGLSACVIWVPWQRIGRIVGPDSWKIWFHECAHALGFSRAMTKADIEAELNHTKDLPAYVSLWGDGPAMREPCGASVWSDGTKPGRLVPVDR